MPRVAPSAEASTGPRAGRAPDATEWVALTGAAGLAVACALAPDGPHGIEDGPVICPFRRLTGLPCPGCGLTRSWVYLAHGWWRESFAAHPFGFVAALAAVALCAAVVVARVRRVPSPDLDAIVRRPVVVVVIAAWLAFAAWRLVTVDYG